MLSIVGASNILFFTVSARLCHRPCHTRTTPSPPSVSTPTSASAHVKVLSTQHARRQSLCYGATQPACLPRGTLQCPRQPHPSPRGITGETSTKTRIEPGMRPRGTYGCLQVPEAPCRERSSNDRSRPKMFSRLKQHRSRAARQLTQPDSRHTDRLPTDPLHLPHEIGHGLHDRLSERFSISLRVTCSNIEGWQNPLASLTVPS